MADDIYGSVNGVRNQIVNEPLATPLRDDTRDAIFIFGTAADGPLYTPIKPDPNNIENDLGQFVLNQYSDRNLIKAYYEALSAGATDPNFNVRLIRVGNTGNASLSLYENLATGSGDLSPTDKSLSVLLRFDQSGTDGNSASAVVTGSGSYPTALTINLPDGVSKSFYMDVTGATAGYIKDTGELIAAVMADEDIIASGLVATTELLEADYTFVYDGSPEVDILSGTESYGNNLIDIPYAYSETERTDTTISGVSTSVLTDAPNKDENPATTTIDEFKAVKLAEVALAAAAVSDVGGNTFNLDCITDTYWLSGASSITDLVVTLTRSGVDYVLTAQSTADTSTGIVTITLSGTFAAGYVIGDKITVDYKYVLGYAEANVRSDLVTGTQSSYFVSGDTITFGASQPYAVDITYQGIKEYLWGSDIVLVDEDESIIRFNKPDNRPTLGDTVVLTLQYLPELPAPTSETLSDATTQVSGFSGGSDGQSMTTKEYKAEVEKAFKLTFGYPCAAIVVAGAYIDDTLTGYNSETGLKETQNAGWQTVLAAHVLEKTQFVNEAKGYIGLKPLVARDPESIDDYIESLITVSSTDSLRPANIVTLLDSYPLIVLANDFIVAVPKVVSDSVYVTSPTIIYAVARQLQDKTTSPIALINKMPDSVRGLSINSVGWYKLKQINTMRYTFFHRDITGGTFNIIPADAPTMAAAGSSLDRQYVLDAVWICLRDLRSALQSFIGKKNDQRTRTVMENVAKSILKEKTPHLITAFDVRVYTDGRDKIDGNTKIKYVLKTSREIRTISEETRIKLA